MTYRWLHDMDQALAAHGIPYVEEPNWRTTGRPASDFQFNPQGVLCHHTASPAGTSDRTDINVIQAGNSSAPGPISQLYIGRSGTLYLIAAGRANHGGKGIRPGWDSSCQDMNELLLGIEGGNNGVGEHWSDAQTTIYGQVVNALCEWYGWEIGAQVFLHATTGPPNQGCNSKIDPAGPWQRQPELTHQTWDLGIWRQFCIEQGAGPGPGPTPPPPGDDDMPTPCGFIQCNAGTTGHHVDGSGYSCPVNGTTFRVNPGGTIQWVHAGELDDQVAILNAAGARTDTWNGAVGSPDSFGRLVGDKPA